MFYSSSGFQEILFFLLRYVLFDDIIILMKKIPFIFLCVFTNLIVSHLGSYIAYNYDPDTFETLLLLDDKPLIIVFLVTVVIAPLIETVIYQFAIIVIVFHFFGTRIYSIILAILLSSIIFGLSHYYNPTYAIVATFVGLSFAVFYVLAKFRKDISAVFLIFFTHSLLNFTAFIINDILKP